MSSFPTGQVLRIAVMVVLLVLILVMKRRCGPAAEQMFRAFDSPASDGGLDSR
jgi:hypothetical protein